MSAILECRDGKVSCNLLLITFSKITKTAKVVPLPSRGIGSMEFVLFMTLKSDIVKTLYLPSMFGR